MSRTAYPSVAPLSNAPRNKAKIVCSFSFQQGPAKAAKHSNAYRTKAKQRFHFVSCVQSCASRRAALLSIVSHTKAKISFVHCQAAPHAAEQGSALQTLAKILNPFATAMLSYDKHSTVAQTKAKIHSSICPTHSIAQLCLPLRSGASQAKQSFHLFIAAQRVADLTDAEFCTAMPARAKP